jgi:hypothetical protein
MTKIRNKNANPKKVKTTPFISKSDVTSLDTLAQVDNSTLTASKQPFERNVKSLQRRANAKNITTAIAWKCMDRCKDKYEKKEFYRMYYCSSEIIQDGGKLISRYCNHRACVICCRIRSAKLIAGYQEPLSKLKDPFFVTLTVPNVIAEKLNEELNKMMKILGEIRKRATYLKNKGKLKIGIVGIRKIEITKKNNRHDFHPHFHFIVDGGEAAAFLKIEWLKRYKGTDYKGQDIRRADPNSIFELFKYFTKMFTKEGVNTKPLMVMLKVLYKRHTFRPMGMKKGIEVSEDVEKIASLTYDDLDENDKATWNYNKNMKDWINSETGEILTGYIPTDEEIQLTKTVY